MLHHAGNSGASGDKENRIPPPVGTVVLERNHPGWIHWPFALIKEGLSRHLQMETGVFSIDDLTDQEMHEHNIFQELLELSPGLEQRVLRASEQELHYIADMVQKGAACARADDTKGLKSAIIDWITPKGGALSPPLSRNIKDNRGWFHYRTGELLCPPTLDWTDAEVRRRLRNGEIHVSGDQWPSFLYAEQTINLENPWEGLFQGELLVSAFKHIFTSPSSVESHDTRATRAGNADLHGMTAVTIASLAYVATLVRFSLTSSAVFSRNDKTTDSERFYSSIIVFLQLPSEKAEVDALLTWWNAKVFPSHHTESGAAKVVVPSVMDRLKEWRETQSRGTPFRDLSH